MPNTHDTYRSACGRARVVYRPDWSEAQPWVSYLDGTAKRHFADLDAARAYFKDRHKIRLVC